MRTDEDKICRTPLAVTLGGKTYDVPLLVIKDSRVWRGKVAKALAELPRYANATTDTPEDFGKAMDAMLVALPDTVVDLFFDYAKGLNREEIEAVATDTEIAAAFQEVASTAFPLTGSLAGVMTAKSRQAKPSKSS